MRGKNIFVNQKGYALLSSVILLVAALIVLVVTSMLLTYSEVTGVDRVHRINQVYYATEGAMFETLQHLDNDSTWLDVLPDVHTYMIGGVTLERSVRVDGGNKVIDIEGDRQGIKRRLEASVEFGTENQGMDVALALDVSGSMDNDGYFYYDDLDQDGEDDDILDDCQPVGDLKVAVAGYGSLVDGFVDMLDQDSDYMALVTFNQWVTNSSLTDNFFSIGDDVWNMCQEGNPPSDSTCIAEASPGDLYNVCVGGTNTAAGLEAAYDELLDGRPDSTKAVILFSDGKPTCPRGRKDESEFNCPESDATAVALARTQTIEEAELIKTEGIYMVSIALGSGADLDLMWQIASPKVDDPDPDDPDDYFYYVAPTSRDLQDVFEHVLGDLKTMVSFILRERLPES